MSKTILADVNGWTPLIDELVQRYGIVTASVFGRMWRYCQMENGVCQASLETIADELNMSRMTVIRHVDTLVADGYLFDHTPNLKNKPHTYSDTGKIVMKTTISAVSKSDSGVSQSYSGSNGKLQHAVTESDLKKDSLRNNPRKKKDTVGASAPRPPAESKTDPRSNHPAILLIKGVTGRRPPRAVYDFVIESMGEHPNGETYAKVYKTWCARGFNVNNFEGQLDWYKNGIPARNGNGNGNSNGFKHTPAVQLHPDALLTEEERERKHAETRAKIRALREQAAQEAANANA